MNNITHRTLASKCAEGLRMKYPMLLGLLAVSLPGCMQHQTDLDERPNVIMLIADDLGFGDVAFNGNVIVQTPELDRMAQEGLRLDRFYAGAPVCTPTRASVMTGRNAFRSGTQWPGFYPLPAEEITIAEIFRDNGYRTGYFGKWHLGKLTRDGTERFLGEAPTPEDYMAPWEQGFDVSFAAELGGATYNPAVWDFAWRTVTEGPDKKYIMDRPLQHGEGTLVGNKMHPWPMTFWHEGERRPDVDIAGDSSELITDATLEFVADAVIKDTPFLAVVGFFTPHSPISAGNEDRTPYSDLTMREQHWYGSISAMDKQIGRIRNRLRELGISRNTIVIFFSDNGPSWIHELNSAAPYRGKKGDLLEGGIRVPAILEWPAQLVGNNNVTTALSTDDLLPTLLQAASIPLTIDRPLDGENVLPILKGDTVERSSALYFHSLLRKKPEDWLPDDATQSAIIDGPWKLITVDAGKNYRLYRVDRDPAELKDMAEQYPQRVTEMKSLLDRRIADFGKSAGGADYK